MSPVIGFIGAGQMGEPMVKRLLSAGHHVQVFARRDEVRNRLRGHGATLASSVSELCSRSDILISCLFSDTQLTEISCGPQGVIANAKPGTMLVSHTTGSVSTLADLVAASGGSLRVVDAPVSGTAEDIGNGTLTVLLGGPADAVEEVTPLLGAYADPIIATGELGTALHIKLINNLLFAANSQLVGAATELGQRLGVDAARLLAALQACSGASTASSFVYRIGGLRPFAAGVGPTMRKDISACMAIAEKAGTDLGLLGTVVQTGPMSLTEPKSGIGSAQGGPHG
jgi:3-hydroxyisobutyrate dehydrogenase-like beta-hydroxyacid dehydrogenase